MVLKRLLVTTLGALGLGALAAGPASAQQIPAPDLFDDQVSCSSNVPAGMADAALATALGMTIMDGTEIDLAQDDQSQDIPGNPGGALMNLNYIIPPGNNNCGGGDATVDHDDDGATPEVLATTVSDAIATDVATGYTETLTAYLALRAEDATVKAANKALNDLLMDDIDDDIQTATIAAARETLLGAQTKQTAAQRALSAVGTGPINKLGIAEWQAKFAVEDAVTAWNTAVDGLETAETALNPLNYAKYVPVTSTQLLALVDSNGDVNLANVRQYANAEGDNTSTQDAMTGVITGASAFDAAGNLIVPMEVFDHDDDSDTDNALGPTRASMTYAQVKMRLTEVGDVVKALEKLQTDNKNALLTPAITEAVRRAKAEQVHYEGQFAAMVADTTDLNTDNDNDATTMPDSISARYSKYTAAETVRDNAGVGLTTAFQAREMATSAVAAAFTNPQNFYQQLVDRREFLKSGKEAEVTRLADLTGDDAATEAETTAASAAVTAAETALTAATDAQAAFQSLVADDSPVKDLVNELLKSDATGDDGGELVDAIAGAYDAATGASDANTERLDALLTATDTDTETMTPVVDADGNLVLNDDGTPMMETTTTTTTTESGRIPDIETRIDELFGAGDDDMDDNGTIAGLRTDIDGNEARIDELLTPADADAGTDESGRIVDIETSVGAGDEETLAAAGEAADAGDAATLAAAGEAADAGDAAEAAMRHEADMMLAGAIMDEETARVDADTAEATDRLAADMMLAGAIDDEVADRATGDTALGGRIDTNVEMIGTNVTNIAANATAIMAEQTARTEADMMLGGRIDMEATDRMAGDAANAADIMTNAGNIVANEMSIGVNASGISSNADSIAANMSSIGSNASAISDNRNMIGELSDDLGVVRAGVAASMALAGMPGINGRGISIGVGSFDGESAFAVGFQIQGEMASFKVGLTSGGGATGASAGVGFQF